MDQNELIKNNPLSEMVRAAPISDGQKNELLEVIPHLNEEERVKLLENLKDILLMETEKRDTLKDIRK